MNYWSYGPDVALAQHVECHILKARAAVREAKRGLKRELKDARFHFRGRAVRKTTKIRCSST